ncbi:arginase family protein [Pendulispora rubella]|uniref:Arginase family protein n=1 Tax=Pendulispora rubella TaxID=2741070 RepID=A0ABZ2LL31_9BACT
MPLLVPYHLDEHLADFDWPAEATRTVTRPESPPGATTWEPLRALYEQVASAVAQETGRTAVVAGDCMASLGIVAGLQRRGLDPSVVWFDAHGDVQTLETSTSGYLAGMPLRMLAGYGRPYLADPLGLRTVRESRIRLVGARDLDPPEVTYLANSEIRRCTVEDLDEAQLPDGPIYLHLDVDVIDPGDLPGLTFPANDGPSLTAVRSALRRVLATGRTAAVCIACNWHRHRGAGTILRELASELLA